MSIEDLLGDLLGGQQDSSGQQAAGQNPLAGLLGGLLGGQTAGQSGAQQDPMSQLLGGLLGGGAAQNQQAAGQSSQLGNVLGMLEGLMGSAGQNSQSSGAQAQASAGMSGNDPMMQMLSPLVDKLAAKINIPPQVAMMVVTFVVHQLLSSQQASGRQTMIDPGQLQTELSSGQGVSRDYLKTSGLVNKLVEKTGLDKQTATKSLKAVFDMLGQQ